MAKDKLHKLVKEVLINDGWLITHDPYQLKVLGGGRSNCAKTCAS